MCYVVKRLTDNIIELAHKYRRYRYRMVTNLFILRGPPDYIRSDNGPECIAQKVRDWIAAFGAKTADIEPGSPWETPVFWHRWTWRMRWNQMRQLLRIGLFSESYRQPAPR